MKDLGEAVNMDEMNALRTLLKSSITYSESGILESVRYNVEIVTRLST